MRVTIENVHENDSSKRVTLRVISCLEQVFSFCLSQLKFN